MSVLTRSLPNDFTLSNAFIEGNRIVLEGNVSFGEVNYVLENKTTELVLTAYLKATGMMYDISATTALEILKALGVTNKESKLYRKSSVELKSLKINFGNWGVLHSTPDMWLNAIDIIVEHDAFETYRRKQEKQVAKEYEENKRKLSPFSALNALK